MKTMTVALAVLVLACSLQAVSARERKEHDSDLIYDESKVPHYDLPPLLVSAEGEKITTPQAWRETRRPQIVALFSSLVYGQVPQPADPIKTQYTVRQRGLDFG